MRDKWDSTPLWVFYLHIKMKYSIKKKTCMTEFACNHVSVFLLCASICCFNSSGISSNLYIYIPLQFNLWPSLSLLIQISDESLYCCAWRKLSTDSCTKSATFLMLHKYMHDKIRIRNCLYRVHSLSIENKISSGQLSPTTLKHSSQ